MADLRFKLPPGGDVPPVVAARRLGLTLQAFEQKLAELRNRGFPPADPTTGNYDLDAIDAWRKLRYPQVFPASLTPPTTARNASDVVRRRLAEIRGGQREN
jgi:hypothetical protein